MASATASETSLTVGRATGHLVTCPNCLDVVDTGQVKAHAVRSIVCNGRQHAIAVIELDRNGRREALDHMDQSLVLLGAIENVVSMARSAQLNGGTRVMLEGLVNDEPVPS